MKTLRVDLPGRAYDIHIERGALDRAGELCRGALPRCTRLFVVTDSNVAPLHLGRVVKSLEEAGFETACQEIPAGESSKSPAMLTELWENMMDFGLTRTDAVAALGGGVVGDLAGFAAATVLRGVDFIQIPTTLLAQVDSSVGGKVAVDLRAGKNLAGAFWQPRLVLMDPEVLETLPDGVFSDGMAEVIKYGCIQDAAFFDFLAQRPSRGEIMAQIEHILYTCCDLKRRVVVEDERDVGARLVLNFGHTLGHAYELAGNYTRWTPGWCGPPSWARNWASPPPGRGSASPRCWRHSPCPPPSPAPGRSTPPPWGWTKREAGETSRSSCWRRWGRRSPTG